MQLARNYMTSRQGMGLIGLIVAVVGLAVFIYGTVNYAMGKGYNGALGLLGLLSCVGLVVLVLLPDKHKNG
jgi:hypothetical protein